MPKEKLLLTDICEHLGERGNVYYDYFIGKGGFRRVGGISVFGDRLDFVKVELGCSIGVDPVDIGDGYLYKRELKGNKHYEFDAVLISEKEVLSKDLPGCRVAQLLRTNLVDF